VARKTAAQKDREANEAAAAAFAQNGSPGRIINEQQLNAVLNFIEASRPGWTVGETYQLVNVLKSLPFEELVPASTVEMADPPESPKP
jgi:hypothetical protein